MSNQREITEQLDALSIYHFLLNYTTLEEMIKSLYVENGLTLIMKFNNALCFIKVD